MSHQHLPHPQHRASGSGSSRYGSLDKSVQPDNHEELTGAELIREREAEEKSKRKKKLLGRKERVNDEDTEVWIYIYIYILSQYSHPC